MTHFYYRFIKASLHAVIKNLMIIIVVVKFCPSKQNKLHYFVIPLNILFRTCVKFYFFSSTGY